MLMLLGEMGVNLENHEEFNIQKMENRAEEFNDMPSLPNLGKSQGSTKSGVQWKY